MTEGGPGQAGHHDDASDTGHGGRRLGGGSDISPRPLPRLQSAEALVSQILFADADDAPAGNFRKSVETRTSDGGSRQLFFASLGTRAHGQVVPKPGPGVPSLSTLKPEWVIMMTHVTELETTLGWLLRVQKWNLNI